MNGFVSFISLYPPIVANSGEHSVSQIWAQTGACDTWNEYGVNNCVNGGSGSTQAVQSLEVGAIVSSGMEDAPQQLFAYFTADGYNVTGCYAGQTSCCTTGVDSSCWIAWPGASYVVNQTLDFNEIGEDPVELAIQVYQWATLGPQYGGWLVYINGSVIGWYPPNTYYYPGTQNPGPMAYGVATYEQAGGEVFDDEVNSSHTNTEMGSGYIPPLFEYGWSAYQRNIMYINSSNQDNTLGLTFHAPNSCEEDDGIKGLCEYGMASWTNDVYPGCGAYNIVPNSGAPSGQNWGEYFYFGGGQAWAEGGTGVCSH